MLLGSRKGRTRAERGGQRHRGVGGEERPGKKRSTLIFGFLATPRRPGRGPARAPVPGGSGPYPNAGGISGTSKASQELALLSGSPRFPPYSFSHRHVASKRQQRKIWSG